ncbi:hypothetical protein FACS1894124_8770 [Spirochaetia bacterium]|nr:hypothetical protein FACS1894124_8770 [Spirochaetia bacterium]
MTHNLTCITCPIGCALTAEVGPGGSDSGITVTGNRCPRGAAYAKEEILAPKRVVTATCGIVGASGEAICAIVDATRSKAAGGVSGTASAAGVLGTTPPKPHVSRRAPVKSAVPCPKERINELLADIYKTTVKLPVKAGDTVIANWRGTGIDVVTVRNLG